MIVMPDVAPLPVDRPSINVVANRLPVAWTDGEGWRRAPGGLVTALEAFVRCCPVAWFGSEAALGSHGGPTPAWEHGPLHPISTEPAVAEQAINGVANSTLWPALHGLRGRVRWHDDWWDSYVAFNRRFAAAVAAQAAPDGLVWVHDYHLLLVPMMLAIERPDLAIGLSIHTPFDADAMSELPCADAIAEALASPVAVGMQTHRDVLEVQRFVRGRGMGSVSAVLSPVSVDPEVLTTLARDPVTLALATRLRHDLGDRRRLIVGIDRLDYTKAIPERIKAIDRAFRHGSIHPDDVEIVQIAQPTRAQLAMYRDLRLTVERSAHEVASRWLRSDGTTPLHVVVQPRSRREVTGLLSVADIALVTPVRDGMNLVAKEFSIVNEERGGVLVLSRGAGAAEELGDGSVLVDGADPASVADGIEAAVGLDDASRRTWASQRAATVRGWTAHDWAASFCRTVIERSGVSNEGAVSECLDAMQTRIPTSL